MNSNVCLILNWFGFLVIWCGIHFSASSDLETSMRVDSKLFTGDGFAVVVECR